MQPTETVILVRYVKALCPQQAIDSYTPDAWHDMLGHLEFAEARAAAIAVGAKQPFISPSEIIAEIAANRGADLEHSEACRGHDHRNCRSVAWCMCHCHPEAVTKIAGPPSAVAALKDREARQLKAPKPHEPVAWWNA